MTNENGSNFVCAASVLVAGFLIAFALYGLKDSLNQRSTFELNQQGPIFIRFNTYSGEVCFSGVTPNPNQKTLSFLTKSWVCLDGKKTSPGESIEELMEKMPELQQQATQSPDSKKKGK
ncbi:MAG: hypothetical protein SFT81_05475 [Candidatus Caenarcaniphilales bacterium]|nr:hypothetical protein [Candidatus Caenarcaniphilales bacterium]